MKPEEHYQYLLDAKAMRERALRIDEAAHSKLTICAQGEKFKEWPEASKTAHKECILQMEASISRNRQRISEIEGQIGELKSSIDASEVLGE